MRQCSLLVDESCPEVWCSQERGCRKAGRGSKSQPGGGGRASPVFLFFFIFYRGGCVINNAQLTLNPEHLLTDTGITPEQARDIYSATVEDIGKQFGCSEEMLKDRSRVDFNVAKRLVAMGDGVEVVVAVLMAGSEKAKERRIEYAIRTVTRAMA